MRLSFKEVEVAPPRGGRVTARAMSGDFPCRLRGGEDAGTRAMMECGGVSVRQVWLLDHTRQLDDAPVEKIE